MHSATTKPPILASILLAIFCFSALPIAANASSPRLAVMDLKPQKGIDLSEACSLTGLLRTALHGTGAFTLINREDMESIADLYVIELAVCDDDRCLLKLGTLLGAEEMVAGDVGKVLDGYVINVRLVEIAEDTLRNKGVASEIAQGNLAAFQKAMIRLADALVGKVEGGPGSGGKTESRIEPADGEVREFNGMEFVWIPPGRFLMGSPESERGRYDNETQHEVGISTGFWMSRTEITQGVWRRVMGENSSSFSSCGDDCPVEMVSWLDAIVFCNVLSSKEDLTRSYAVDEGEQVTWNRAARGYRLPTEAEWEHACRAGTATRYGFGDDDASLPRYGWYANNSSGKYRPVGQKKPNDWGLYDMHGNVWEWCWDYCDGDYHLSSSEWDPRGPSTGRYRVLRGGCWYLPARNLRSAYRYGSVPTSATNKGGFRCVRDP